jgi:hypothetical protein
VNVYEYVTGHLVHQDTQREREREREPVSSNSMMTQHVVQSVESLVLYCDIPRLCLGEGRQDRIDLGEVPMTGFTHQEEQLVRDLAVHHHTQLASDLEQRADGIDGLWRMRRVMHDSEAPDQIVHSIVRVTQHRCQLLGIGMHERRLQAIHLEALLAHVETLETQIHYCQDCSCSCKVDAFGAQAASDLKHSLAVPSVEHGEARYVWLDAILALLDLVKVLFATDRRQRVADVARSLVPILLDLVDWHAGEVGLTGIEDFEFVHVGGRGCEADKAR